MVKRMKLGRVAFSAIALVTAVVVLCAVLANSAVQTWLAHRYLASHPAWGVSLAKIDAGWHRLEIDGLVVHGRRVHVTAPVVHADVNVPALLLSRSCDIEKLSVTGWTANLVDPVPQADPAHAALAKPAPTPASGAIPAGEATAAANATPSADAAEREFPGVFREFTLPFDCTVQQLDLAGVVTWPGGSAQVHASGGGLAAGRTGILRYTVELARPGWGPAQVHLAGSAQLTLGMARAFTAAQLHADITGSGGTMTQTMTLQADFDAAQMGNVERYTARVSGARPLLRLATEFARDSQRVEGTWELDANDSDLAAFASDRRLPTFASTGTGHFETDTRGQSLRVDGSLNVTADHLERVDPGLGAIGAVRVALDLDVSRHLGEISVAKLNAIASSDEAKPVAAVRALQAFAFDPKVGEIKPSDAAQPLLGITLAALPLRWLKPFLGAYSVTGGDVRAEFVATPRARGLTFASKTPLSVSHLSLAHAGTDLLTRADVALSVTGDYTPQGWQAEFKDCTVQAGGATLARLNAKTGRLATGDRTLKAAGKVTIDLGAIAMQPVGKELAAVKRGDIAADFVAAVGATTDVQAGLKITGLVTSDAAGAAVQPTIAASLRASVDAARMLKVNVPITFERGGRASDVTFSATFATGSAPFEAHLSSTQLVVADVEPLRAVFAGTDSRTSPRDAAAPWLGLNGSMTLDLKHIVAGKAVEMSDVTGLVRFAGGAVKLENVRAGMGGSGEGRVAAALHRDGSGNFVFGSDLAVTDFDPAPLFRTLDSRQPPVIEGRFTVTTKLQARGPRLTDLPRAAVGEFECTSKAGIFRGLPVNVGNLVENSGKLSAWLAAAGDAIRSPFIGRKDQDEITSRSQAANQLARMLSSIAYDQLSLVISREEPEVARVKEFTLISPELRIHGAGVARHPAGTPLAREIVDLDLSVRARGRTGELMKYLGILESTPDDLGYAACTIPIRVEGGLDRLDTSELSNRLVALAVQKSGLTEKAVDWINRLRGKSPN